MTERFDIAIVGAGIAGASLAAALAPGATVLILESESQPGYHATGRSAAFWSESYGGPMIQPLTTASGPFMTEHGFLSPRGALTVARAEEFALLDEFAATFGQLGVRIKQLDRNDIETRVPGLRPDWQRGVYEPDCQDIDVAALHQLYLATARKADAQLRCKAEFLRAERQSGHWRIDLTGGQTVHATLLVNAAGAWADDVAIRAGVSPLGMTPLRRTMVQLQSAPAPSDDLPVVLGIDGSFYFKPEAGRLWLSPHDEIPSTPCDAAPEEIDVAVAIDRFEHVVDWQVTRVEHRWAGLRTFAPDRLPVYGFDPAVSGFFWCAGQGGFGIQTAPAAADLAARLVLGDSPGAVDPAPYRPERFR